MRDFIWLPNQNPPVVETAAADIIASRIQSEGIVKVYQEGLETLQDIHEPLGLYLDRFGADLNEAAEEQWPERTLKIGAALAISAYIESGFTEPIGEDAFEVGQFIAEMNGIPDTYIASVPEDSRLLDLTRLALDTPLFDETALMHQHSGGFAQVINIGAGCSRHYVQQTLAA